MRPVPSRVPFRISSVAIGVFTALALSANVAFGAPSAVRSYDVQDGDTLYGIAVKLGIDDDIAGSWVKQVLDLNSLSDDSMLKVGLKLELPDPGKISRDHAKAVISNAPAARTYTVQDGDTLFDIAYNAGVPVADQQFWIGRVLELNDMDEGDSLVLGQKLQLPASPKDASAGVSLSTVSGTTGGSSSSSTTTYKVKDGDSLSSIADSLGVSAGGQASWISSVLQLNGKDSPDALSVGETLKIPGKSSSSSSSASNKPNGYTVKAGDTLYSIADAKGIKDADRIDWIHTVLNLNSLSDADTLVEGQVLQLPIPGQTSSNTVAPPPVASAAKSGPATGQAFFTVQSGDNLFKIAARLNIPPEQQISWIYDVVKLNNLKDATSLKNGQTLTMPATTATTTAVPSSTSSSSSSSSAAPAPSSSNAPAASTSGNSSSSSSAPAAVSSITPPAANSGSSSGSSSTTTSGSTPTTNSSSSATTGGSSTTTGSGADQRSCFYVVQASDNWDSMSKKLGISASKKDTWVSSVQSLNGISTVLPVGDAIPPALLTQVT